MVLLMAPKKKFHRYLRHGVGVASDQAHLCLLLMDTAKNKSKQRTFISFGEITSSTVSSGLLWIWRD